MVRPRLNAALDKAAAYAPSRADVHRLADAVLDEVPVVLRRMERALYCQDLLLAVKTLLVLFALELLGCLFSGATLIVLAAVALFAVPIVYERHQAQIDRTVSQAVTTVGGIVDKGCVAVSGRGGGVWVDLTLNSLCPRFCTDWRLCPAARSRSKHTHCYFCAPPPLLFCFFCDFRNTGCWEEDGGGDRRCLEHGLVDGGRG